MAGARWLGARNAGPGLILRTVHMTNLESQCIVMRHKVVNRDGHCPGGLILTNTLRVVGRRRSAARMSLLNLEQPNDRRRRSKRLAPFIVFVMAMNNCHLREARRP